MLCLMVALEWILSAQATPLSLVELREVPLRGGLFLYTDPKPAPILRKELDASSFESGLQLAEGVKAASHRISASGFHVPNGIYAYAGRFSKLRLLPARQRPRSFKLIPRHLCFTPK